jgi:hypothetical protein
MTDGRRAISWSWVAASLLVFLVIELLVGGLVASMLAERSVSHMLSLRIELLMSLVSFLGGGLIVGLISPGPRLVEPAIGAAITVVFTFLISFFTPITFFAAEPGRMLIGGGIAFGLALFGAHLGERITGN